MPTRHPTTIRVAGSFGNPISEVQRVSSSNRGIGMSRNQFQKLPHGPTERMRVTKLAPALGCVGLLAFSAYFSRDVTGGDQVVANAVAKANAFLATLDGQQR